MSFPKIPSHPNFFTLQEEILQFWEENNIFEKSINQRSSDNSYRFYDWPPFKNGLPHYGHALQSTIKDIIPRFWSMKGKKIERKRWWDCHGIYIEQKVQKKLGLESNKDIEAYGIDKFMKACLDFTNEANDEWDRFIPNLGRRVDFRNAYETSSPAYMESVRWVFKNLWEKDLIYKGKRVSMYSTKLNTAISSFEVQADNSYAEVPDPAITVKFPVNGFTKYEKTEYFREKWYLNEVWLLEVVLAIIKDKDWKVLTMYDEKHWWWWFPWWKAEKWETLEEALIRECKEELWIDIRIIKKAWTNAFIARKHGARQTFFDVEIISWEPKCLESNHHDISYAEIIQSENKYWFGIKVQNLIFEDEENIFDQLLLLYQYYTITKYNQKW
jgi:8-oxo-dGTP pyrophosphatase MutT (NUDIX family)